MTPLSSLPGVDATGKTDTTAAIQAALNARNGAPTDFLVDGTFLVNPAGLWLPAGANLLTARDGAGVFRAMPASYPNALLTAFGRAGFYVGGIAFDFTAATGVTNGASVIACLDCSDFEIEACTLSGQWRFGIALNRITAARIRRNKIGLTKPNGTDGNEAILIVDGPGNSNIRIEGNVCTNSGMDLCLSDSEINGNTVSGWMFGAGITTSQSPYCYRLGISGNRLSGGVGTDVNNTVVEGIENWAPHTRMDRNFIWDCAGAAIANAGANCVIAHNICVNNAGGAPQNVAGYGAGTLYDCNVVA